MNLIETKHTKENYSAAIEEFYNSYYSKLVTPFTQNAKKYFNLRNPNLLKTASSIAPFAFFLMLFYIGFFILWIVSDRSAVTLGNMLIFITFVITAVAYLTLWLKRKSPFFQLFLVLSHQVFGKGYWKNILHSLSKRGVAKFNECTVTFKLHPEILILVTPTETREINLSSIKIWAQGERGIYLIRRMNTWNEQPQIIILDSKEKLNQLATYLRNNQVKELS